MHFPQIRVMSPFLKDTGHRTPNAGLSFAVKSIAS